MKNNDISYNIIRGMILLMDIYTVSQIIYNNRSVTGLHY